MARTVQEVIAETDRLQPNVYSNEQKVNWLNALEGRVWQEVFLQTAVGWSPYTWPDDQETRLLVESPHDDIYGLWLRAQIHAANGEWDEYANVVALYNDAFGDFVRWFATLYHPARGWYRDD